MCVLPVEVFLPPIAEQLPAFAAPNSLASRQYIRQSCPVTASRVRYVSSYVRISTDSSSYLWCAVYLDHPQQSHFQHLHRTPVRHCFQLVERILLGIYPQQLAITT